MLRQIMKGAAAGAAAGAAGTSALNAVTYVDMTIRGRPSSETPAQVVERLADRANVEVPGDDDGRGNRLSGLGALSGIGTGVAVGTAYGVARALGWRPPWLAGAVIVAMAALVGADGPIAVLGVSDPRSWSPSDWVSDAVPHAAYGMVTAATCAALTSSRPRRVRVR
jgi:hypothetical protein